MFLATVFIDLLKYSYVKLETCYLWIVLRKKQSWLN